MVQWLRVEGLAVQALECGLALSDRISAAMP